MNPNITLRAVVLGRTEWSSTEWKSVGRFRGSKTIEVAVKDEHGKPAYRASYRVVIRIVCSDGVVYRFLHDTDAHYHGEAKIRLHGQGYAELHVHGTSFHISSHDHDRIPERVRALHKRTVLRVRACLRVLRAEFAVLPSFKPLPQTKGE